MLHRGNCIILDMLPTVLNEICNTYLPKGLLNPLFFSIPETGNGVFLSFVLTCTHTNTTRCVPIFLCAFLLAARTAEVVVM